MPISAAALDGLRDNGLGWKHKIKIGSQTGRLGVDGDDMGEEEIKAMRLSVVKAGRAFVTSIGAFTDAGVAVEEALDDLEDCPDEIHSVRVTLAHLYDHFDYHRIVVVP